MEATAADTVHLTVATVINMDLSTVSLTVTSRRMLLQQVLRSEQVGHAEEVSVEV